MKKYLFGVFAIALAVGFSSFKATKAPVRFEYKLSTFTQAQVQNPANYELGTSIECEAFDKACMIEVEEANTVETQDGLRLDGSKVAIQAADSDNNTHFAISNVTATTGSPLWDNKN